MDELKTRVENATKYLRSLTRLGIEYATCDDGIDMNVDAPPAFGVDGMPPCAGEIKNVSCSGLGNLCLRQLGLPVPKHESITRYDGGTCAWWFVYKNAAVPFTYQAAEEGDIAFKKYKSWDDQGHWAYVALRNGVPYVIQSFPNMTVNDDYTLEESHCGDYYTHLIKAKDWLGQKRFSIINMYLTTQISGYYDYLRYDGKNFYHCVVENKTMSIWQIPSNKIIKIILFDDEIEDIHCISVADDIYVIIINKEMREQHMVLYKNGGIADEIMIRGFSYSSPRQDGNIICHYNNELVKYHIEGDKFAITHISTVADIARPWQYQISDGDCVYRISNYEIYRYKRENKSSVAKCMPNCSMAFSNCGKYLVMRKHHMMGDTQLIKLTDIDFDSGKMPAANIIDVYSPNRHVAEFTADHKKYIVSITDCMAFADKQYKIIPDFHGYRYSYNDGGGFMLFTCIDNIRIFSLKWNRRNIHSQTSVVKRTVLAIIVLLKRVYPELPRELIWMIVDAVMRN